MFFTNVFYYIYLILFSLNNEFPYTKCSLLSRVKNPVEHILTTTPESLYELPGNIYRYEPFIGHRTLWRPTTTNRQASLKQQRQTVSRTGAKIVKHQYRPLVGSYRESSTIQSYWHHFDDDEGAWPKVVLLLSSTEGTTTRRKQNKKTFASYFTHLHHRYTTATTNSEDVNENNEGDNVTETFKTSTNSISLNYDRFNDNVFHLRAEDHIEKEEAKDIVVATRINMTTTTTENPSNMTERNINEIKVGTVVMKEMGLKTREELKKEEEVNKVKKINKKVKINKKGKQKLNIKLKRKAEKDTKDTNGKNSNDGDDGPRCYQCGLNVPEIPSIPSCHQIFSSDDRKFIFLKPKYRVKCKKSYKGGCVRRYVDIGMTYDERGCRTMPPMLGESFASGRMAVLEKSMHSLRQGCMSSPYASLTPFSKAISLFARYHVCICIGRYCNQGNVVQADSLTFTICLVSTIFTFSTFLTGWT